MTMPHFPSEAPDLALHETASEWFMRRRDASWTPDDEAAFQAWLAAAARHQAAFDSVSRTWADFSAIPRPALASDTTRQRPPKSAAPPPVRPAATQAPGRPGFWARLPGHRAFAPAAVALCVLLAAGGWYRWDNTPSYTLDVATAPGETRHLDLPDGSVVNLNFGSTLQLRYYPRRREAVLDRGEAFFKVAPDPSKPFTVDSGESRVAVVGTSFNVRAAPPQFVVKVLEGRVHVTPNRADPGRVLALGPEHGVSIDPATGSYQPVAAMAESVGDWRGGRLVFRRTPLAEVAQEVARYLGRPVVLRGDGQIQGLAVSGYADIRMPGVFLDALPDLLPVRVKHEADGSYVISRR
ncbi:MAG: iron dicitrate transport regulator FecR [Comamonadaceae bacterium SCN 68-20]|nr:FecR domain-containing protein [Comamonadaceae bacterium]ODU59007.1 MAG: iron dicitrate transport regulator FecR [Comamonadaceae bacterium SCN 68-20]OJX27902.1 MAG: iron dicitrate transport regulator FecR [Burkholderiales bacterium 68-20]